jgi:hypothetical protein
MACFPLKSSQSLSLLYVHGAQAAIVVCRDSASEGNGGGVQKASESLSAVE